MSATIAVDILVGAIQLSPAQQRVLREVQSYVRGGHVVPKPTREALVRVGLFERSGGGHTTTVWGDAIGEELVAREAAKDEYLPEITWKDGKGWLDGHRFQVVIHGPQSYVLDDTQGRVNRVFKTLVHAQQLVREILADEARDQEIQEAKAALVADAARTAEGWRKLGDEYDAWVAKGKPAVHDPETKARLAAMLPKREVTLVIPTAEARPGDRVVNIEGEDLGPDGPVVLAAARPIYGDSGPWGVRITGPRTHAVFLDVEAIETITVSRIVTED